MARRHEQTAQFTGTNEMAHDRIVYVVQFGTGRPIKVGSTVNLGARLSKMSIDHYEPVEMLYLHRGGFKEERAIHKRFARYRLRGEWYSPAPEVIEWCEAECEQQSVVALVRSIEWAVLRKEAIAEEHQGLIVKQKSVTLNPHYMNRSVVQVKKRTP